MWTWWTEHSVLEFSCPFHVLLKETCVSADLPHIRLFDFPLLYLKQSSLTYSSCITWPSHSPFRFLLWHPSPPFLSFILNFIELKFTKNKSMAHGSLKTLYNPGHHHPNYKCQAQWAVKPMLAVTPTLTLLSKINRPETSEHWSLRALLHSAVYVSTFILVTECCKYYGLVIHLEVQCSDT